MRYRGIDAVYVRVKLLYKHNRTPQGYLTNRSPALSPNDRREGVSEKSDRTTWRSGWTPRFWKFSRKSYWAFPSWNRTWRRGAGSEEEDLEPRGFQDGVDLHLGAMCSLSKRERERKKHITTRNREMKGYVHMKYAWTCDMQNWNCIMGKT